MDLVHVVRHKVLVEKQSQRKVARELGISRNTARRYVDGAPPEVRKARPYAKPVSSVVGARIEALLGESARWTGGKQRLTAKRLHELLLSEGHRVGYTLVKERVAAWKQRRREVFIPLEYVAGDLAEVDFFEVLVDIHGVRRKAHMFVMRLMSSGRDFACLFPQQDQVAFLEGHVRAFTYFGGVPSRIAYDNLKAAVARILVGGERLLSKRFLGLATHYVFEPCFARPRQGHDKGGVEARGRSIRHQSLVPIPEGASLEEINGRLIADIQRRYEANAASVEKWGKEHRALRPLPEHAFRAARTYCMAASSRSMCRIAGAHYSVPCTWANRDITAHVGVSEVEFVGPDGIAVRRPRLGFGERHVDYRDFLPELAQKPQALRQVATTLCQQLGEPFGALWQSLVEESGPRDAARAMCRVLAAIIELGMTEVRRRVEQTRGKAVLVALFSEVKPPRPLENLPECLKVTVAATSVASYDVLMGGAR